MSEPGPRTVFCIATYEKGQEFIRQAKRLGCRVLLLTDETLKDADWPRGGMLLNFEYIPARDNISGGEVFQDHPG